jgi:hypothetical protein
MSMHRVFLSACVLFFLVSTGAQAARVNIDVRGISIPVEVAGGYASATLTLGGPNGWIAQRVLAAADAGRFKLPDVALADGQYRYRIDFAPAVVPTRAGNGVDGRAPGTRATAATMPAVEGSFRIEGGHAMAAAAASSKTDAGTVSTAKSLDTPSPADVVTADDVIIQGSACIGLDCVDGESFGFDTLRLKENNTRIKFFDTSVAAGFANTNWQLTANDSVSGGLNKFSIEDITAATIPFTVLGAAPTNALYVDTRGRIGLRTSTPLLDVHLLTGDTPGLRLDQSSANGFTAQTWDVAGNEANFFVRDVSGGSRLPFRIRPGAPTSSIDIDAAGNVGVGTASPAARIDIAYNVVLDAPIPVLRVNNNDASVDAAQRDRFVVDSAGNVLARGTISQLSSRSAKENFRTTDGQLLLAKLEQMPIDSWNYRGAPTKERHVGPVAEDFHAAFGLGRSERYIAPTDMAGVALASVKALQQEIKQRDEHIQELERRLQALEARLDAPSR